RGDQLLLMQQEAIIRASGMSDSALQAAKAINTKVFDIVAKSTNPKQLTTDLTAVLKQLLKDNPAAKPQGMSDSDFIEATVAQVSAPWMQYFIKYDPAQALEKVQCPVLALAGSKDLQVPATVNLEAIKEALVKGKNKNASAREIPNLNHLFQECATGLPSEYATIEQTFSPIALEEILQWLKYGQADELN
uniref:alpha/beta hydrolase family protein n=1 Tax=Candidatus Symbiothrix dinenymphae TaxID=467085 RepID=UPI000ACD3784